MYTFVVDMDYQSNMLKITNDYSYFGEQQGRKQYQKSC